MWLDWLGPPVTIQDLKISALWPLEVSRQFGSGKVWKSSDIRIKEKQVL